MSDESRPEEQPGSGDPETGDGPEDPASAKGRRGFSDGLRQGLGVLSAFKEAIEETISEARERGDLSADRARQAVKGALDRAQSAAGEARERFDFPLQKDFDALVARVEAIERRLAMQGGGSHEAADGPDADGDGPAGA